MFSRLKFLVNRDYFIVKLAMFSFICMLLITHNLSLIYFDILISIYKNMIYATAVILFIFCIWLFFYMIINQVERPLLSYWEYTKKVISYDGVWYCIIMFLLSVSLLSYTVIKSSIPEVNFFYLDFKMVELDEWLHFGTAPWKITHFIFSSYYFTGFINFIYNCWFFIIWLFLVFYCISTKDLEHRKVVLTSYILCWVINGGIFSTLLSSVGPCYIMDFYSSSYYSELFTILGSQNEQLISSESWLRVWVLKTQPFLYDRYLERSSEVGSGISAMPSMHVSIAFLMALCVPKDYKALKVLFIIFALLIFIGSIHLGWHYALDGYVSIFLTLLIYKTTHYYVYYQYKNESATTLK